MNWQKSYDRKVLDKGYDYYIDDRVENLKLKDNVLTAFVYGNDKYNVRIIFDDDEVFETDCTCPYAEDGNYCKHMAAVLYQWENDFNKGEAHSGNKTSADDVYENSAASLVMAADSEVIKKFLIRILDNNEKLLLQFKNIVLSKVTEIDIKKYKMQIDKIVMSYSGRDDYIEYDEAYGFCNTISEFLTDAIGAMIDNENYVEAFELTNYVFVTIAEVDIDDSGGGTAELASQCYDMWYRILDGVNIKDKTLMFKWFTDRLDGSTLDYMEEYIINIVMEGFPEQEYHNTLLEFADKNVLEAKNSSDSWSGRHQYGKWALYRLSLMESSNCDWDDLERYCTEHWASTEVRKYYVKKCLEKNDYSRAVDVLKESISMDSGLSGLVSEYNIKLRDIYKMTGNTEQYREQLWQLVLNQKIGDLNIYRELKALYPETEWLIQREKVFKTLSQHHSIDDYYKEEGLYDRLLDVAINSSGLYKIDKHFDVLKQDYSAQMLKKYRSELELMAARASDRKRYNEMVSILKKMAVLEGGKDVVNEISRNWRKNYGNRRAMMDELNRLKI